MKQLLLEQKKERFRRAAKESLLAFTEYTKPDYRANWHHISYAGVLDRFISGEIKRLMVFMPPQHGKSELCSRRMPAKILGDHPNKRIAVCAYNYPFASKFNRDVQRIIDSKEYKEIYPETTLSGRNIRADYKGSWLRNSDEFEIVGFRGSLISVGIGGGLTGNKVDVAIIDDPYKDAVEANSQAFRKRLEEWWDAVLETRLNNDAQICLTFTRWRHDDIAGRLLELQKMGITTDDWVVVKYQGIKEANVTPPGDIRKVGEALWEEEHSAERLNNVRKKTPTFFEALYQQRPSARTGNIVKDKYLFRYEPHTLPEGTNHIYIDTATSEEELKNNDPTGILVWRKHQGRLYLVYFAKGRWGMPDLIRNIKTIHQQHCNGRRSKVYIENKSNARSVKQMLSGDVMLNIVLDNIKGKKLERLENELPTLEAQKVGVPVGEMWVDSFMEQIKGFPLTSHDEEIDCLTGAMRKAFGNANNGLQFLGQY